MYNSQAKDLKPFTYKGFAVFRFRHKQEEANESLLAFAARGDVLHPALKALFEARPQPDINARDAAGRTALHLAAQEGAAKGAALLLAHGADLNAPDKAGDTPLMTALARGRHGVAGDLLLAGANTDAKNAAGKTAADIAAESGDGDILALLPYLRHEKPLDGLRQAREQTAKDMRVVAAAKEFTGAGELQKALDAGGSPNAVDSGGYSALLWAATRYDPGEVELLVARGADVNFQDARSSLYTPLMTAASRGNLPVVAALLKLGAGTTLTNKDGKTAYDLALGAGESQAAILLAREKLRLAGMEEEKEPAQKSLVTAELEAAVLTNDPFAQHAALRKGADIWFELPGGYNLLTYAAATQRNHLLALLLEQGADPDRSDAKGRVAIVTAAENGNGLAVRGLLAAGADANAQDAAGNNALGRASLDDSKTINALIAAKADPNVRGGRGATFMESMALWEGGTRTIAALIAAGADFDAAGQDGNTPLMLSLHAGWHENAETLLNAGARPDIRNDAGETPLDLARRSGLKDLAARIETLQQAKEQAGEMTAAAAKKEEKRGAKPAPKPPQPAA